MTHTNGNTSEQTTQQLWRDAVAITTLRAKDTLGTEYASRLDKAQTIVLSGGVQPGSDSDYVVASETEAERAYGIMQDTCECVDATRKGKNCAPEGRCKHVLAVWVWRRSLKHMQADIDAQVVQPPAAAAAAVPAEPLPEAPLSISLKGTVLGRPGTLVTVRGRTVAEVQAHLADAAVLFDAEPEPETQCRKIEGFGEIDGEGLPYCTPHSTPFFRNVPKGGGKPWYSHRTAEGGWCRFKG